MLRARVLLLLELRFKLDLLSMLGLDGFFFNDPSDGIPELKRLLEGGGDWLDSRRSVSNRGSRLHCSLSRVEIEELLISSRNRDDIGSRSGRPSNTPPKLFKSSAAVREDAKYDCGCMIFGLS